MAKVVVKVLGGDLKEIEAETVRDVKQQMNLANYTASINGEPASDDDYLENDQLITLSPAVKGGA